MVAEDSLRVHLRPYAALATGILSIGFSPIFIRWAGAPGTVAAFYRVAVAAVLLAWPFFHRRRPLRTLPRRGLLLAILGGFAFALDTGTWATGVVLSGAVNPTLMANTAPLWVGLGARLLFGERMRAAFWMGLGLTLAGASLVLGLDALRSAAVGLGTLLGLAAGLFYAVYFLVTQRGRDLLDALAYFWLSTASAAAFLFVLNVALDHSLGGYSQQTYLSLLGLGVVSQAIGWLSLNYAQGHLPASIVAPSALGQPVVSAMLAGPLLGELLEGWQIVGAITVLVGMLIVHRSRLAGNRERLTSPESASKA